MCVVSKYPATRVSRPALKKFAALLMVAGLCVYNAPASSQQAGELRASLNELLFKAIIADDLNAVRSIVEAGADLLRPNMRGKTAMDVAINNGRFEIAQHLVLARRLQQRRANLANLAPAPRKPSTSMPSSSGISLEATVHQQSPEAAPQIEITKSNKAAIVDTSENKPADLTKEIAAPVTEPIRKTVEEQSYDRILNAADRLAKAAEALAKASTQKPPAAVLPEKEVQPEPAAIEAEESAPKQALKTVFLLPKPGRKPEYRRPRRVVNVETISNGQPKVYSPTVKRVEGTTRKLTIISVKPVAEKEPPGTVHIRPKRRISPELLDKLRRRLKTVEIPPRKEPVKSEPVRRVRSAPNLAPTPIAPKLPKPVEIDSIPPAKSLRNTNFKATPVKLEKTEATETVPQPNLVGKFFNGIGDFFGLGEKSSQEEISAKKREIKIAKLKSKPITPAPVAAPIQPAQNPAQFKSNNLVKNHQSIAAPFRDPLIKANQPEYKPTISKPAPPPPQTVALKKAPTPVAKPVASQQVETPGILSTIKEALAPRKDIAVELNKIKAKAKNFEEAKAEVRRTARSMPLNRLRKPLTNVVLTLGDSVATGQSKLPRGIAEPDACIRKRRGAVSFCIVPVDWPRSIENAFAVNTMLYQGTRAIARYDGGKANHYHALFDSQDYAQIVDFLKKRYGPPTDIWKRVIAPFDKPRQPNPTYVWRSRDTETDKVTILEVRKFDDARAIFPDTEHGAIRLYGAGGPPVFPVITALDIMKIEWAARSDHIDGGAPTVAKTLRVTP